MELAHVRSDDPFSSFVYSFCYSIGIVNEPPPPLPPVVTPTSGTENSINFIAPNLTPETVGHHCMIVTKLLLLLYGNSSLQPCNRGSEKLHQE